jgi:hypothetical protein
MDEDVRRARERVDPERVGQSINIWTAMHSDVTE